MRFESTALGRPCLSPDRPRRGSQTTTCNSLLVVGSLRPLLAGQTPPNLTLPIVATAREIPQRPASDEERYLVPTEAGVHHSMPLRVPGPTDVLGSREHSTLKPMPRLQC